MSELDGKILCETPTLGKKPVRIDTWKYHAVSNAIMSVLPDDGDGMLFSKLPKLVAKKLSEDDKRRLGSISWYTTTVKLDLEAKGRIRRVNCASPQRLLRVKR